jgi:hypothetical protein
LLGSAHEQSNVQITRQVLDELVGICIRLLVGLPGNIEETIDTSLEIVSCTESSRVPMSFNLNTVDALIFKIKWLRLVSDMIVQSCVYKLFNRTMTIRSTQLKDISTNSTASRTLGYFAYSNQ